MYPQQVQMPAPLASLDYRNPVMSPYCAVGLNQTPGTALYMQWPTQSMIYAQSYDQLRHAFVQVSSFIITDFSINIPPCCYVH